MDWASPSFHAQARAWVAEVLAGHDCGRVGLRDGVEQPHLRAWSSALRLVADDGSVLWFKVDGEGTRFEPGLLRLLADVVPDLAPEVLAVDETRGWSLTRDAGPVLRTALPAADAWAVWRDVLGRYAAAQVTLAGHRDAVLGCGVDDLTPRRLPVELRRLVETLSSRPVEAGGLRPEDRRRLDALLPAYDDWCAELDAAPVPDSVQHDDLHSANVCRPEDGPPGRERVIDWGDASWGCPLGTMLTTMRSLAFHAGLSGPPQAPDAEEVLRARDAYLEPFTALAGRTDLLRWTDLARRTGCVTKALSYERALRGAEPEVEAGLEFPVRAWLLELADPGD